MKRRDAVKNLGMAFGTFVVTPTAIGLLQSCQAPQVKWIPAFYSEEEGKVVRRLVDTFLPSVEDLPSATEVNVHVFVDKFVKDVMDFEDRKSHRESLQVTIKNLLASSGKETVDDLSDSDYDSFLTTNLSKSKEEDEALSDQIEAHLDANDDDPTGLPEMVRVYSYLTGLRGMSIWAYKSNELVGETILAYKPVPGEQRGCVDVQEATGGRIWSL